MGLGAAFWFNAYPAGPLARAAGSACCSFMLFGWFGTVIGETEARLYNQKVDLSFRWSMSWFIFSEVMFFGAFFGALFYTRISVPMAGRRGRQLLTDSPAVARLTRRNWPTTGRTASAVLADGRWSASRC